MKRKTWIVLISIIAAIILVGINIKPIDYYSKQLFSQSIKEFKTTWRQNGRITSFEATYHDEDLRLARLELGSSWKHVKNLYGGPFKKKVFTTPSPNNADYTVYYTYWFYPDFEVGFENSAPKTRPAPEDIGQIFVITVKTDRFKSYRGIRISDPVAKVMERYGAPAEGIFDDRGSKFYEWQLCYLRFGVSKGKGPKVSEIELGENLD